MSTPASRSGSHARCTSASVCSECGCSPWIASARPGHGDGDELDAGVEVVDGLLVASAGDRGLRGEQPDTAVARRLPGGVGLRRHDAEHGQPRLALQGGQRSGRGRVARDHDELHAARLEQPVELAGVAEQLVAGARPVGETARVAEVDEVLVGEPDEAGVEDGQPSHSRVEHADRRAARHLPEGSRASRRRATAPHDVQATSARTSRRRSETKGSSRTSAVCSPHVLAAHDACQRGSARPRRPRSARAAPPPRGPCARRPDAARPAPTR